MVKDGNTNCLQILMCIDLTDWELSDLSEKGSGFFREVLVWAGIHILGTA